MTTRQGKNGFTLIEVLVVVIIIAALAGMVLPRFITRAEEARKDISYAEIAGITTALRFYYLDNNRYPSSEEGLNALMARPPSAKNWKGPYLEKDPVDPWKRPYKYQYPGDKNKGGFDLWSLGPKEDGSEPIGNWDKR